MGSLARIAVAALLLTNAICAAAFETMQHVRGSGVLRVGVHHDHLQRPGTELARRFAESIGVKAELVRFERGDALIAALERGDIDLVGSPVDMQRPISEALGFSVPVDSAALRLTGRYGPVLVRFGSDEWHRAMALRRTGRSIPLQVMPAASSRQALRPTAGARALVWGADADGASQLIADRQPRAWVVRRADRVLAFKVDRFLYADALLRDARRRTQVPEASLIRAAIQGMSFSDFDHLAREYARYYGFDWRLVMAVMHTESRFDPAAVSRSGARGLMQLKPEAAQEVGITDVGDPRNNVLAGVRYLAWARAQFEPDLDPAQRTWFTLAAYNGGYSRVVAARELAARTGRDPRRWAGSVAHAMLELGRQRGDFDARQIVDYVEKVRSRFATYVRVTEGPPRPPSTLTSSDTVLAP